MLLNLSLPLINDQMNGTRVSVVHAPEGSAVPLGGKLLDVVLTMGGAGAHDCPPEGHYRLSARDRVWVRRWLVRRGDQPSAGTLLGLFSTERDEPLDASPARQMRLTIAGIVPDFDFGDDNA